ncbi:MAG: MEDS domain-containing protein [Armatimonadota bacterium]
MPFFKKRRVYSIDDIKPGDHLSFLYETEEEHKELLKHYLVQGLRRGEKVVYIVDSHTEEEITSYFIGTEFENIYEYIKKGQFTVLSIGESYFKEGIFDPDKMISLLVSETEKALSDGYTALRATGEMSWALKGLPGSERLMEYEAKLNRAFPYIKCIGLCQYDKRKFEGKDIIKVYSTHPTVVTGTKFQPSTYYI